jgi:hypothetical protein
VLFAEQTPDSLIDALRRFEPRAFSPQACRENALRFDRPRFRQRFGELLRSLR